MKVAIIGAGISGLSIAHLLNENGHNTTLFESENKPGGLIKCKRINGNLFHCTGGHVFNTKRKDVLEWFWKYFNKEAEFTKAERNAAVYLTDERIIPYPIENYIYLLDTDTIKSFISDLTLMIKNGNNIQADNFEEFLKNRFGITLYNLYFQPYNYKVWRRDLRKIPLSWLEGKLPMPTVEELIYNNINHVKEQTFVHSSFYYPKQDGSQFIANRFAKDLNIMYGSAINKIEYIKQTKQWEINQILFDRVIFCGNIKQLPKIIKNIDISAYVNDIERLEYHGTTSVFCEIDKNPYSWIYQPNKIHESHRIICTGNFAKDNNSNGKMTGTIEFTDFISKDDIIQDLKKMPYNPNYLTHNYAKYTYPIQHKNTREMISNLKKEVESYGLYLHGRFAEWEYYNMDVAIGAAIDLIQRFK